MNFEYLSVEVASQHVFNTRTYMPCIPYIIGPANSVSAVESAYPLDPPNICHVHNYNLKGHVLHRVIVIIGLHVCGTISIGRH